MSLIHIVYTTAYDYSRVLEKECAGMVAGYTNERDLGGIKVRHDLKWGMRNAKVRRRL